MRCEVAKFEERGFLHAARKVLCFMVGRESSRPSKWPDFHSGSTSTSTRQHVNTSTSAPSWLLSSFRCTALAREEELSSALVALFDLVCWVCGACLSCHVQNSTRYPSTGNVATPRRGPVHTRPEQLKSFRQAS
mmetsp:Transcript_12364/g.24036  ORF Transcript_12364/g.24036 Transcript_12364/m.24036 type:complete len:134 (-) Transcript_12364:151-552(-)